ncbi:MAG: AMP-binding protein [Bacteroidota bacterium]|nr:AMP-binding protein [Bacteroidota bacterium]
MSDSVSTILTNTQGSPLGPVVPNIASMLEHNVRHLPRGGTFCQLTRNGWQGPNWLNLVETVCMIARGLRENGLREGEAVAIVSQNRLEMLELELAVMASGGVAVPIFPFYPPAMLDHLLEFSGARIVAVQGAAQLQRMSPTSQIERLFVFDDVRDVRFPDLLPFGLLTEGVVRQTDDAHLDPFDLSALSFGADPDAICLRQYTSGTTAKRKLVELSHRNILSQQAALEEVWNLNENDRLLSYLPWHHSFGGIFELFTSLYRRVPMWLEPSFGKDPRSILEQCEQIRPTAFFSVPRVYQSLVDLVRGDREALEAFFHPDLKFVFTAAAPLPEFVAREFEQHGVRIIEGWGLTETSPCCTITGVQSKRKSGIVGHPIPGIELRIASDGEIQVHGPNVMRGYFANDEANAASFTEDGWFRTGDIGSLSEEGLRLIGRNDRIFKLSNGEKIVSADIERALQGACPYLTFVVLEGRGEKFPVALLFPNRGLLRGQGHESDHPANAGCVCPRSLDDLSQCLHGCLVEANETITPKFARVPYAILVDDELSIDSGTLTPSMKVIPDKVVAAYRSAIDRIYRNVESEATPPMGNHFVVALQSSTSAH